MKVLEQIECSRTFSVHSIVLRKYMTHWHWRYWFLYGPVIAGSTVRSSARALSLKISPLFI